MKKRVCRKRCVIKRSHQAKKAPKRVERTKPERLQVRIERFRDSILHEAQQGALMPDVHKSFVRSGLKVYGLLNTSVERWYELKALSVLRGAEGWL
jgi:hypothetical protein